MRKVAAHNKVAWLLRGRITELKPGVKRDVKLEGVGWTARVEISVSFDLIDPASGKTLHTWTGKGGKSIFLRGDQQPALSPFSRENNNSPTLAEYAVNECLLGDGKKKKGLAFEIKRDYPQDKWTVPTLNKVVAQLRVEVKADSAEGAAKAGVQELFTKLVPAPSEMQKFHLEKELLPNAQKLVSVENGKEKGLYVVSVPIDDMQGSQPNLIRELGRLGDLELASIGVIAANQTLQTELENALQLAGFKVKNEARLSSLRNISYVEGMLEGKTDPLALQSLQDAAAGFDYLLFADVTVESQRSNSGSNAALASIRAKIMDPATATFITIATDNRFG